MNQYQYDKDTIKNSLTLEQVFDLVDELGGEPILKNGFFISRTICHNPAGQGSYKLYYYDNTKLFKCFTDCDSYMDIFDLVKKQKTISSGVEWTLTQSISFVAFYFGFSSQDLDFGDGNFKTPDWKILENYERLNNFENKKQIVELKVFDDSILKHLPRPIIIPWEEEGISREVINRQNISYDPVNEGIIIPHYNIDGKLIGIRERTLIKENEKFGKYRPAILNGVMYNHSLSFNLYNLNNSKNAIKIIKKAIVFEAEKSTMLYQTIFGINSDISVACCGSSLVGYQVSLLLSLGVEEIIIAFDRQYQNLNDEEHKRWVKKLKSIHAKFSPYVKISFIFDIDGLLEYKQSPIEQGKDIFLELFKRRIIL